MKIVGKNNNVVQLLEVFEDDSTVYMVLEFASNGDLL